MICLEGKSRENDVNTYDTNHRAVHKPEEKEQDLSKEREN